MRIGSLAILKWMGDRKKDKTCGIILLGWQYYNKKLKTYEHWTFSLTWTPYPKSRNFIPYPPKGGYRIHSNISVIGWRRPRIGDLCFSWRRGAK